MQKYVSASSTVVVVDLDARADRFSERPQRPGN